MKVLNKTIIEYIISITIFLMIIIGLAVFITLRFIHSNIYEVYKDNDVLIELNPKVNKKLDKLSDIEGMSSSFYKINLTNNGKRKKYQIYISPLNDNDDNIRISLDNYIIRYLSSFEKVDDKYFIYEADIKSDYSLLHKIRIWQDKLSDKDNLKVNLKISVKIEEG